MTLRSVGIGRHFSSRARALSIVVVVVMLAACGEADPGFNGKSSAYWIGRLADSSPNERAFAANSLGGVLRLNPNYVPAVHALIGALSDTADEVRVAAGNALVREGVRAPDAVPGLLAVLRDSAHAEVRAQGARVLGAVLAQLGSPRRKAGAAENAKALETGVEALVPATTDADVRVRIAAARALVGLGASGMGASPRVRPAIAALVTSPVAELRVLAIQGLSDSNTGDTGDTIPLLNSARGALADSAEEVRLAAVGALERLGPTAKAAVPDLVRTLGDQKSTVRGASATALGKIGPELATAALQRALKDPSAYVRQEAAHALEGFHRAGNSDPPPPEPGQSRP